MSDSANPMSILTRPGNRRWAAIALTVICAAGIWGVSRWASAPTYVPLFRGLELKDVGSVTDGLTKSGIRYHLDGGGTDVLVPLADVARARVALAKEGLPASGRPGLELFDKPAWGMTDFTQRVTFQRALEGELARTIASLQGIDHVEVHLVLPAQSPLRRLEHAAGASVVLTLKPGISLTSETVQGITYIVSNSVEQLAPDNVAVIDDAGRVLSMPSADGSGTGLTTRQLEIQRSVEHQLSAKIEDMLATVVGIGRARAQVAAKLSFDQVDRTVDTFDPDGQVLQTEQRSETSPGAAGDASGAQTIVSNNYQNSRRIEKITGAVGNVSKLTVSVLIDKAALAAAGSKDLTTERLRSMVANAIGVDSLRGDRLSVEAVAFEPLAKPDANAAKPKAPPMDLVLVADRVTRPVVGIAAIVVLLVLALRILKMGKSPAQLPAGATPNGNGAANGAELANGQSAELAMLRNRLNSGGGWERPELAAQVLRNWLTESE
jgi:flagellar M-ring protein FliF